ncbi:MAG: hypothetical protein LBL07_19845 [Tannerella sp.]|jgi:hypothetical protein|nr:hypothetical protein [Tannerella sp.]
MAKKITADEPANLSGNETLNPVSETTASGNEENTGESKDKKELETPAAGGEISEKTLPAPETNPVVENLPPFVEAIFKAFPVYETLYIDAQGGVYAPETHSEVRGKAPLYKNPYHK